MSDARPAGDDLDALLTRIERHHRHEDVEWLASRGICRACRERWPCPLARLAAAVRECRADSDTLRRARELAHAYGKGRELLLDPRIAALLDFLVDGGTDG